MEADRRRRLLEQLRDVLAVTRADLARLAEQVAVFHAAVSTRTPSNVEVFGAGALLHGYYGVLERWMERIARDLNAGLPEGPDWHRTLLRSMTLDKPGRRPAVFDEAIAKELGRYLAFRHLFRHLYVLDLQWSEMQPLLVDLEDIHRRVDERLGRFDAALASALAASTP
ncbi:MAG: hypothetical protein HYY06_09135 [Deltaproteobacteria bacterium]|nr:hypothetical protein [Deltaproteobacteria bacterium]